MITVNLLTNKSTYVLNDELETNYSTNERGYKVIQSENNATKIIVNYPTGYGTYNKYVEMTNAKGQSTLLELGSDLEFTLPNTMTFAGNTILVFTAVADDIKVVWQKVIIPITATGVDFKNIALGSEDVLIEAIEASKKAEEIYQKYLAGELNGRDGSDGRDGKDGLGGNLTVINNNELELEAGKRYISVIDNVSEEGLVSVNLQEETYEEEIKKIKEEIEELNSISDLSLTREFISEEVGNGAVVGSICEVEKIEGRSVASANLWNYDNLELGGLYGTLNATYESTKYSTTIRCRANDLIAIKANSQIKAIIGAGKSIGIQEFNSNKLRTKDSGWQTLDTIIQLQSDTSYICLSCKNNDDSTITLSDFNDIMITYDTTLTEYTPYYTGFKHLEFSKLESTGVNLFDSDNALFDFNSGTYGFIDISSFNGKAKIIIEEKDSSVDISGIYFGLTTNGANSSGGFAWLINNGELVLNERSVTYDYLSIYPNNQVAFDKVKSRFNIMITYDTTSTEYVPYELIDTINYGDIELKAYDYIYGVKKYSQSESVTFNGSESWGSYGNSTHTFTTASPSLIIKGVDSYGWGHIASSEFDKTKGVYMSRTSLVIVSVPGMTLEEFKTYLSSNPLTIVYQTETPTETSLNIFPYLNIVNNGNLTFNSNLSVPNTIIYPLNTKSEVARLSSLVGKLDNEIVELRSENESLAINLAATKEELDNVSEYFTTTSMSQRGETGTLESSDLYPASASLNIGKGRNVLSVSVSGNVNYTSSYNTATGIYSFSISSSTASVSFTASVTYALKDINDFIK